MKEHPDDFDLTANNASEAIEIMLNDLKKHGYIPKDLKLSDLARKDLKQFMDKIMSDDYSHSTTKNLIDRIFSDAVYGFFLGYNHGRMLQQV